VQKPYERKMEYLAKVWDGSRGEVGDELARECRMRYREVVAFGHHGKVKRVTVEFGVVPVLLPTSRTGSCT
jgi:hypothetical protein